MAALYLHNAIFIPEPSDTTYSHSRTISSTTLRTVTTDQSYPTEPLLPDQVYQDLLSNQPQYDSSAGRGLSLDDTFAPASTEKQGKRVRKRLRVFKVTWFILELVLGAFKCAFMTTNSNSYTRNMGSIQYNPLLYCFRRKRTNHFTCPRNQHRAHHGLLDLRINHLYHPHPNSFPSHSQILISLSSLFLFNCTRYCQFGVDHSLEKFARKV